MDNPSSGGKLYFNLGNISEDVLRMVKNNMKMDCQKMEMFLF